MARLTKQQIGLHKEWLSNWRSPDHMLEYVDEVTNSVGSADFFTQPGLAFLRDAWAAAKLGLARKAIAVRLVVDEWPDFEIEIDKLVEQFEYTEADIPGRKRGDEYRSASDAGFPVEYDPVEDWEERARLIPQAIKNAVSKKIQKQYSKKVNLLIYLNIDEWGIRQREIEACFDITVGIAKDSFTNVWVLWKDRLYPPE